MDGVSLRVAIVCDGIGEVVAGSFISTLRFAERLHARGHRIVLISSGSWRTSKERELRGLPVHRLPGVLVPWSNGQLRLAVPRMRQLEAILHAEAIDVVHITIPMPLGLVTTRVAKRRGIPVVMHSHTQAENIFLHTPRMGRETITRRFSAYLSWFYRQGNVIVYPSAFACRQFPNLAACRHVVISNGVDRSVFRPVPAEAFQRRFHLSKGKQYLLYLGRLHPEKSVETLIEALPLIVRHHPSVHLLLVGLGHQRAALAALAERLGVTNSLTFCGFVPDEELPAAYAAGDLFVLPSIAELEGMAVLEAMACGKPLLIADSKSSAAVDFVDGNGALFRVRDPDDLARQASRLLADPSGLQMMGQTSLSKSLAFDIDRSVAALECVYSSVLPSK